ncbi:TetR/AcrR family transcriptional regulator [Nocardia puris]|uniref:TetR family transcriptional regulator n=1 Tax=Nocardia puris TaxID=208602 RepID=A0A366DQN5_9NOCA|nr:TetR/AcrR family transcriptional regulator [Nocardia puris]MBF6213612.1 TetR/AcrR family transcriptional regulator [Nocardia puris]MBF6365458.1 TetR/AcrR family transcriptional regulator [Nocardia puris]MBF6459924.1 TetR/AcrR family transcriptional regulator [Nocardia puris]RBO91594.1 TetR family transcriptional regulator [Nocardia puris]
MDASTEARDSHRERLLSAARALLRERDYGTITARDLVSASRTNLGSIGYHFGSKEALLNAAIGLALEEWSEAAIDAGRDTADDGPTALINAVRRILDNQDGVRPFYQAFIAALARSAHSPELERQLAEHYNRQRDRVAESVRDLLPAQTPVDSVRGISSLVIALVDGLMVQSYVARGDAPAGAEIPDLVMTVLASAADFGRPAQRMPPAEPGRRDRG